MLPFVFSYRSLPVISSSHRLANRGKQFTHFVRYNSFVKDELRPYAVKMHPPELMKGKSSTPQKIPTKQEFLQYLVDNLEVYRMLEKTVNEIPEFSPLKNHGLERTKPLEEDIQFLLTSDSGLKKVDCGKYGREYVTYLQDLITYDKEKIPKLLSHLYNFHVAHTAGGMIIGNHLMKSLFDGKQFAFYKWKNDDLPTVKAEFEKTVDDITEHWRHNEKKACIDEMVLVFNYSGDLLRYIMVPPKFGI
jgi:hypothetical protein